MAQITESRLEDLWASVKILQNFYEFKPFYRKVEALNPTIGAEIGCEWGGTLRFWLEAMDQGRMIAIDTSPPDRIQDLIKNPGPNKSVSFIWGESQHPSTIGRVNEALGQDRLDFLFIDGGHKYEEVRADYDNYSPLVRRGGIIGFHDVGDGADITQCVGKCWNEIKGDLDNPEIFYSPGAEQTFRGSGHFGSLGIAMGYKR